MSAWIRQNILGLIAIFIALSGTAVATQVTNDSAQPAAKKKVKRGPPGPAGPQGLQGPQGPVGPATGDAGGDLIGSYPNPQIRAGAVGSAELTDFLGVAPIDYSTSTPHVRVTNSVNEPIANATPTVLTFNAERYDSNFMHSTVTDNSRLVATQGTAGAAPYLITASVQFAANATGVRTVTLRSEGTTSIASDTRQATSTGPTEITISTLAFLGDGQYVEVLVNQTSGGPLDVVKSDEISPEFAISYLPGGAD